MTNLIFTSYTPAGMQTRTIVLSGGIAIEENGTNITVDTSAVVTANLENTNAHGIVFYDGDAQKLNTDSYFQYNGNQANLNLVDSWGGLHVLGRSGGEASISIHPDTVSNGDAGQWVWGTNGSGLEAPADFGLYNAPTGISFYISQSTNNIYLGASVADGSGAQLQVAGATSATNFLPKGNSLDVSTGSSAGASPSASTSDSSTDLAGQISVTTGAGATSGTLATIIPETPYGGCISAILSPANAETAAIMSTIYTTLSDNGWTISATPGPSAATYTFNYVAVYAASS